MINNYHLREAIQSDCPALLKLIRELAVYEKAEEEVTVSLDEMTESGFGANPVWKAFVIEIDKEIVGISLFYIRYSTWKGRRLYLEDIVITERLRGKGLGKVLMDKTIAYAQEKKYSGMMWQVLDWNESAINFYKKYKVDFDGKWLNVSLDF